MRGFIRTVAACSAVALISGCSWHHDSKREHLVASYTSQKPAREVAECVARSWNNASGLHNPVSVRQTQTGFRIPMVSKGETTLILEVDTADAGSVSRYYKAMVWTEDKWDRAVRHCQ